MKATFSIDLSGVYDLEMLSPRAIKQIVRVDEVFEAEPVDATERAEGQTFVIRYLDSSGQESLRGITLLKIGRGDTQNVLLTAFCHYRKKVRTFRVDRIIECIDYNGEIFSDVPSFIYENTGFYFDDNEISALRDKGSVRSIIEKFNPDCVLLAAIMRADGSIVRDEIGEILDYLEKEIEREGLGSSERVLKSVADYVFRLAPGARAIQQSLEVISSYPHRRIRSLLSACQKVVDADGNRQSSEIKLLNELSLELIGVPIV